MKKITLTVISMFALNTGFSSNIGLQNLNQSITKLSNETITFKVSGNVACKSQIESIITSIEGVVSAVWDANTKMMTVIFDSGTVKKDRFYVALAEGGYDNQELHAKSINYEELPAACRYTREAEND
jgi:hypothetical protein